MPSTFKPCFVVLLASQFFVTGPRATADQPSPTTERTVMPLWPHGVPGADHQAEGDVPQLIVTQVTSDRPTAAVVVLPGGGYWTRAIDHEGYQIADWLAGQGITSAICAYRVRGQGNGGEGYGHPYPMMDAQRAIQTVRAEAKDWNVDPDRVGVIGFSAGGHLASTVSTRLQAGDADSDDVVSRVSSRPDFAILGYPVIALDQDFTHRGSQKNLLGTDADAELIESLSNEKQVTERTPPTFIFHTAEDKVVPVQNALVYASACVTAGVPVELHVFPQGRHGIGLGAGVPGASAWPKLCEAWLKRQW